MKPQELVLASGSFASIRPVLYRDFTEALKTSDQMAAVLIARCVTIDGKALTLDQVLDLDIDDALPLMSAMTAILTKASALKGGIA